MKEKLTVFFKAIPGYLKKTGQNMKQWPMYKKLDCAFWLAAGVTLITLIAMLVAYANSMSVTIEGTKTLTDLAIIQQNLVAGVALAFFVSLGLAIFTLVIGIVQKKKKGQ